MPDFAARKTGLFIPYWEAKLWFYGLEYAETKERPVLHFKGLLKNELF
jgi:hypothetical protein